MDIGMTEMQSVFAGAWPVVVIPDNNPAIEYVRNGAQLAARIGDFEIFMLPNGGMREKAAIHEDS
jgi:hypothetical protein